MFGGLAAGAAELGLPKCHEPQQGRGAERVLRLRLWQAEASEKLRRQYIPLRGGAETPLDHVAPSTLPGALEKVRARKLAHVIVHLLAGKSQPPRQSRRRVGLAQSPQNAEPKRMQQGRGAPHFGDAVPRGRLERAL